MEYSAAARLPIDHVNIIQDMACVRKSNKKKGNNFIIVCDIKAPLNSVVAKEVRNWLFSRLNLIQHPAVWHDQDSGQYCWNILINNHGLKDEIKYNNNEGIKIIFFIHTFGKLDEWDKHQLIIENENAEYYEMSADYLLEHMGGEPEYVVGVGISAVSPEYMSEAWWGEIKGRDGFMTKPMWYRFHSTEDQNEWSTVRETSFGFGWKNYPPISNKEILQEIEFSQREAARQRADISGQIYNLIQHGDAEWGNY